MESTFDDRSEANTDQLDRSTRLLALLTTQLDSAPRRSTRSTLPTLYLISMYLPRFLADRTNGGAYATVALRPSPSASSLSVKCG